ncbi:hypothetical protein SASPL_138612 [Salvia splendens]|uniref:Flotillin-like n=1 Tax=Salvia splendens TaxID=180675 RepID=A0A8X8ZEG6_SALSN|nr:hypothetical protein SASPL_138612 [Salvia splendens]
MYKVAKASEYLVITGGWIKDMKLTRKSWVFPGQRCTRIDLSPVNYTFQVQAMSAEKLPFILPAIQLELNQFGLLIYNANVKQLVDVPGHEYFSYLGQKVQMEAANQNDYENSLSFLSPINTVGAKLRNGQMQNAAKIDAETKIISTQRQGEGKKQEFKVETESKKTVAIREAELQREVERMNALTTTEKLKADLLTKATVEFETKSQAANAVLYAKQKAAEAYLYEKQKESEAVKAAAEAELYQRKQKVEGDLPR